MTHREKLKIIVDGDLTLELVSECHCETLFQLIERNRSFMDPWLPWVARTTSRDQVLDFIRLSASRFAMANGFDCAIVYRQSVAGVIGLHGIDGNRFTSIGYWLAPSHQGLGIMTKACNSLVAFCFREFGIQQVVIRCATTNIKSKAVAVRCGFRRYPEVEEWGAQSFEVFYKGASNSFIL